MFPKDKNEEKSWFMVTLVGKDQPGIVSKITRTLFQSHCNLGEASMARLGGNFSVMLMVQFDGTAEALDRLLAPVSDSLNLHHHVDEIHGELMHHVEPDVRITVYGADRAGIVAEVTEAMAEAGLNITNLETDVGGSPENPIYIMQLEGVANQGVDTLKEALDLLSRSKGLEIKLEPIDLLLA
jgi:glycine cleavage system transcriptional repressor